MHTADFSAIPSENRVRVSEARDLRAELRLVHRILVATAIFVPIGAVAFGLLVYVATRIAGAPAGGPVAMGVATGVLAGFFFGSWAGVVASTSDIDHTEEEDGDVPAPAAN